ncbi:MAG: SDR family oxidoreductase, partial [Acidimicrobiia bacterium]|nr:SDR family oxidoreductase [Acidimicrobiia bacterium]
LLDPRLGMLTVGGSARESAIVEDIYRHTIDTISATEDRLGGYVALSEADLFDIEYWDLEQAKLRRAGSPLPLTGQVALVTGAASGIGRACAIALLEAGAAVIGLDLASAVTDVGDRPAYVGLVCDVTDTEAVDGALAHGIRRFGGLDIAVVAAGMFPSSRPIADLDPDEWRATMAVNVDSVAALLQGLHPILVNSPVGGRVVLIGSKNAPAPGPGAAAYSVSKAALTQLGRLSALEWGSDGIRVNIVHPDAVFDTGLWSPDLLEARADSYGLTVDEYKSRTLLSTEVTSAMVGQLVVTLCGPAFAATTGAQIPVDGGNDRVI